MSAPVRAPCWQSDPYTDALRTGRGPLFLRRADGWLLPLDVERWCAGADRTDMSVLARCEGSVLDIGCGPGRLVAALAGRGHRALGVDVSPAAVARTARAGAPALCRSVFDRLPGRGAGVRRCSSTATSVSAATRARCSAGPRNWSPPGAAAGRGRPGRCRRVRTCPGRRRQRRRGVRLPLGPGRRTRPPRPRARDRLERGRAVAGGGPPLHRAPPVRCRRAPGVLGCGGAGPRTLSTGRTTRNRPARSRRCRVGKVPCHGGHTDGPGHPRQPECRSLPVVAGRRAAPQDRRGFSVGQRVDDRSHAAALSAVPGDRRRTPVRQLGGAAPLDRRAARRSTSRMYCRSPACCCSGAC